MDDRTTTRAVELAEHALIAVSGADARSFLHAQLTSDVAQLPAQQARRAGWCSAKGRLLATLLVVPREDEFLLQLARDVAPAVLKRLQMFVLRAKVTLRDASADWAQFGVWGDECAALLDRLAVPRPAHDLGVERADDLVAVRIAERRVLVLARGAPRERLAATLPLAGDTAGWTLEDIRAGVPQVVQATQDAFVPQMVNLQLIAAVDFQKGCYPGQEVVARAQYRGQLKRRMVRVRAPRALRPGQDLFGDETGEPSGTVVSAAGGEALAVVQIAALESGAPLRDARDGPALEVLPLPYAA